MPTLRSHTHLQAAQADTQTKACKRVCLPNRTIDRPLDERKEQRSHKNTCAKGRISCFKNSFVTNQTLVHYIKFCGKVPALRVVVKRS